MAIRLARGAVALGNHWIRPASLTCRRALETATPTDDASSVRLLEVGPRDGLQNIKQSVSTSVKVELIQRLASAGLTAIEATSFVSPKWIPQLADGPDVMKQAVLPLEQKLSDLRFPVLVPNMKGFERAVENSAREVVVFASASEGFSWKNTNCSVDDALNKAEEVAKAAIKKGIAVRGVVSCIFACPYDGPTEPTQVLKVVKRLFDMGCFEVGLGDTLGVGTPSDVQKLLRVLLTEVPANKLAGHYHDTYGQAVANVIKSYDMGLRAFDSSIAGLGGCPYAKGAKGNLATEDIAYTFEKSGVSTGLDMDQLVSTGEWISQQLKQPNGSRAGSALFAKRDSAKEVSATESSTADKLDWKIVEDTGEYNVAQAGNAVKVTLTRPKNGNAMTVAMVEDLTKLFTNLARDKTVFHVILAAEGKYFCTGMDLSSSGSSASNDSSVKSDYYSSLVDLFTSIDHAPQTTIAMVDGPCFGGGVGLTFACDIRLVSKRARFTMTEVKLGLSPAIISKYMAREWGVSFLREAMLTGREVNPSELQRIGAVHAIADDADDLERITQDYLQRLSRCAPQAAAECKELIRLGWSDPAGQQQEARIKNAFANMMAPGSEGEFGLQQFRQKIKTVNWSNFWSTKTAKL